MAESSVHAGLVKGMVDFVGRELGDLKNIAIRDDSVQPLRGERPPRIGGFVPDLYASDVPTTRIIIGEAKTRIDLETLHSEQQISAFLEYLSKSPNGAFLLAVPLNAAATARRILGELSSALTGHPVRTIILDGIAQALTNYGHPC